MDILKMLTLKPFMEWPKDAQDNLPKILEIFTKQQIPIILGHERCFFCGIPIETNDNPEYKPLFFPKAEYDSAIIINLCDKCSISKEGDKVVFHFREVKTGDGADGRGGNTAPG